jgi:hypothetical protein
MPRISTGERDFKEIVDGVKVWVGWQVVQANSRFFTSFRMTIPKLKMKAAGKGGLLGMQRRG